MITRDMQSSLTAMGKGFPALVITGPRQSGKTTLARMVFPDYKYLDLENLVTRRMAQEDPAALISDPRGKYIVDEFQYAPQILSYIKQVSDEQQMDMQFVLTGSNQFTMMKDVSQSLAGRAAIFELLPFSIAEAYPEPVNLDEAIYRGFYPRLVSRAINPGIYYDSYLRTYLQRDVRLLVNVQSMDAFTRFISLCAGRSGSILNRVSLANDAGVDAKTVSNWLSVLQASYIIFLLNPWHGNVSKRLIKSPKLYFYDTGLACRLLQIRNSKDLISHPLRGNLFETMIVSEAMKFYLNRGQVPPLTYYREPRGTEVDIIIDKAGRQYPLEIKSAGIINRSAYSNLDKFCQFDTASGKAYLIYAGEQNWTDHHYRNVSWRSLQAELTELEDGNS